MIKCELKFKKVSSGVPKKKWNTAKLRQESAQEKYEEKIDQEINNLERINGNIECEWSTLKKVIATKNRGSVTI